MKECVDLLKLSRGRYKLAWDPCRSRRDLDPWLRVLPCKYGEIIPYGGSRLRWDCDGHKNTRGRVKRLPYVVVFAEGDRDLCVLFDVSDFERFAKVVKPKRKRKGPGLSPAIVAQNERRKREAAARKSANTRVEAPQGPVDERLGPNVAPGSCRERTRP